jgi:hypothetical protein
VRGVSGGIAGVVWRESARWDYLKAALYLSARERRLPTGLFAGLAGMFPAHAISIGRNRLGGKHSRPPKR